MPATPTERQQVAMNRALDAAIEASFGRPGLIITPSHNGVAPYAAHCYTLALVANVAEGNGQPQQRLAPMPGADATVWAPFTSLSGKPMPTRISWPTVGPMSIESAAAHAALHQLAVEVAQYLAAHLGPEA